MASSGTLRGWVWTRPRRLGLWQISPASAGQNRVGTTWGESLGSGKPWRYGDVGGHALVRAIVGGLDNDLEGRKPVCIGGARAGFLHDPGIVALIRNTFGIIAPDLYSQAIIESRKPSRNRLQTGNCPLALQHRDNGTACNWMSLSFAPSTRHR